MFQFRGLCWCFIYFCLCFFSPQNFLQFLIAQMFYQHLQFSFCHKSHWHQGSLIPTVTTGCRSLFSGIKRVGTGQNRTPASPCMKYVEKRPLTHTSRISGGTDMRSEFPDHMRAKVSILKPPITIPSSCTPKQWSLCLSLTFLPTYKHMCSFPHEIHMIHPARTGIAQAKTWIKSNPSKSVLEIWRDLTKSSSVSLPDGRNRDT